MCVGRVRNKQLNQYNKNRSTFIIPLLIIRYRLPILEFHAKEIKLQKTFFPTAEEKNNNT